MPGPHSSIRARSKAISGRRLAVAAGLFAIVNLVGIVGFKVLVADISWIEAMFMSVITLSTVGYYWIGELTPEAMIFASVLIVCGVTSLSILVTLAAGVVIEDAMNPQKGRKRMEKKIQQLKDHFVICGYGRLGRSVAEDFDKENIPYVIIERDEGIAQELQEQGKLVYQGDATHDETLEGVGVRHARCLVIVTSSDADSLFITVSARLLNPTLSIVARAEEEAAASKIRRAGANRVVTPYHVGATRLVNAALRPKVIDFMEKMLGAEEFYRFEEFVIGENAPIAGQSLAAMSLRQEVGVIAVAIMSQDGQITFNPSGSAVLHSGHTLIAMGNDEHFDKMRELL